MELRDRIDGIQTKTPFAGDPSSGVFAGTAAGLKELPGTLGLRLSGLNDRQAVVVESAAGLRLVSSVDGTAYVALRDEEEGTLFVGHPFVCENRDVVLALSRHTPTSPWTLEAHNPTDKEVTVKLSTDRRFRTFGFERTVELAAGESKDFAEFLFTLKAEANRRMTKRLRDAGVRALCTGGNWWDTMPQTYEREALEVVDNHGYGDHPQPSYQKMPFHINQVSDIKSGNPTYNEPIMKAPTRIFGKPFTITEYNYCMPNRWRADGGVMMGAYSSLQDWDALYRFAWSHSNANMFKQCAAKGFDIVTDPIGQLTEKQIVLMFGRRDVAPAKNAVAYAVKKEEAMEKGLGDMWAKGLFPHPFTQYALVSRIGSFTADNGEKPAIPCTQVWDKSTKGSIPKHTGVSVSDTKEIRIDTKKGDVTVASPRTAAVCSIEKNDLVAGPLSVSGATTFCSVSASAMDSANLVNSRKVLVLHITDVLNTDMVFTNPKMTDTKNWGTLPYLARAGKANVSLKNSNAGLSVYALASDGSRLRKVSAKYIDGAYVFTAEVKAGEGKSAPTMMYELAP